MEQLRRVIYVSRLVGQLGADEEHRLLMLSRRNNRRDDITGFLACSGEHFLQVLEGIPARLEATYSRAQANRRHEAFRLLDDISIHFRAYAGWSMAYLYSLDIADDLRFLHETPHPDLKILNRLLFRIGPEPGDSLV